MLLQSDEPLVHILHESVIKLAKKLGNHIESSFMKDSCITDINSTDQSIYMEVQSIHLGGTSKFLLQKLLNNRDIHIEAFL